MTADELKSMPKGSFVVMKTGCHPVKVKLKLFFKWGIQFEKTLVMPDQGSRPVYYASKSELEAAIIAKYPLIRLEKPMPMPLVQQNNTLKTKT